MTWLNADRKRVMLHREVQEMLTGRYHLSPSLLYSVIRLSRDGATYDVPVEGDWITVAVVAERGEVRVSGSKETIGSDEEDENIQLAPSKAGDKRQGISDGLKTRKSDGRKRGTQSRREPRKYINLKLCALPPRSGTTTQSGDALLQLLLFESDSVVCEDKEDGESKRSYRGGSGGAYEKWCNLGVGSVIAIVNPRVLRPLRVSRYTYLAHYLA